MLNVFGMPLRPCATDPLTGFKRNGCCEECEEDFGEHTICVKMDEEFLLFLRQNGNDLITPQLHIGFPGLLPGDHWCVCLTSWIEAETAGVKPEIDLNATHQSVLNLVPLSTLEIYALVSRKIMAKATPK